MLPNDELKVLRVLWNLYRNEWAKPNMTLLTRFSGRTWKRVRAAIRGLKERGYVEEDRGYLQVVKDSDIPIQTPSNNRYWMD